MHLSQYNGKTLSEVRNALIKQGVKPEERQRLLDELRAYRSKVKSQNAQSRHFRSVWHSYSKPLSDEIQSVRVAMHYKGTVKRTLVLVEYRELLDELMNLFQGFAEGTRSPKEIAVRNGIPNDGEHWTDWIPMQEKEKLAEAFASCRIPGRKMYVPFVRDVKQSVGHGVPREDKTEHGRGDADHHADAGVNVHPSSNSVGT